MKIGTFRRNVLKTVGRGTRPTKLGFKQIARNTVRTHIAQSTIALNLHTGHLLQALTPYILGEQMLPSMATSAMDAFGDMAADLAILCRMLKVKMPTATKKSKLTGTRTSALMHLESLSTDMLEVLHQSLVKGPHMVSVKKTVVLPNKGGLKEERVVEVIDVASEKEIDLLRQETLRQLLDAVVDIYWRLCFNIFKEPPVVVIDAKFAKMQAQFPDIEFDADTEEDEETTAEPVPAPV